MIKHLTLLTVFLTFTLLLYAEDASEPKNEDNSVKVENTESNIVFDDEKFEEGYVERQILRYEAFIKEYQTEINALLKRDVEEKQRLIKLKYIPVIDRELEKESANRENAIVLFENFVRKYPSNTEYTPRAMYRLAELYYERSAIKQEKRLEEYEGKMAEFYEGKLESEPENPVIDFSDSINIYQKIIDTFPDFEYIGGAYYMLGYCLNESGRKEEAVALWQRIIDRNIDTSYIDEVYLRLGEYYFDTNDLSKSLYYFSKGVEFKDGRFYDKILYKLAWTYYRDNQFQKAVDTFTSLVAYADAMKLQGEDKGQDLRKEAVQYIAISYADEEWGSVEKAIDYFSKIDGSSFEIDVFESLGKYYSENSNFSQAKKAYIYILGKYPYYENAPKIHNSLIQMYNRERDFKMASEETDNFAKLYSPDSEWAIKNRANNDAIRYAQELARKALLASAYFHHEQAQQKKSNGYKDEAVSEYTIAAKAYKEYLNRFPYTSESYEITYQLADALYFSGAVDEAVAYYERIRDDKNISKYRTEAAEAVFLCYNEIYEKSPSYSASSEEKKDKPFTKIEKKLIESTDIYLASLKEVPPNAAPISYMTARIYFEHGLFDEAEKRYLQIVNMFPDSEAAFMASRDIVGAYQEKKDWVNVAKWSKILSERLASKNSETGRKAMEEFGLYRLGALFMNASKLQEEERHKEAAEEYLRVVSENPYHENAVKALFNAAYSYEKALMFDSAMKLHERIYKEYPYSEFAADSLWLVAYNAERSYNFEKAVNAYEKLYSDYKTHKNRVNAIYNAGIIRENLQQYVKASNDFMLYYQEKSDTVEGKEAFYNSGYMYEKAKDWKKVINIYTNFISKFKLDSEVSHLVLRCYYRIAKIYEKELNNPKKAESYYKDILEYYSSLKSVPEEGLSYAAEADFKLMEPQFDTYVKLKIGGKNQEQLGESLKAKVEMKNEIEKKYMDILKYGVYEWVVASLYKIGYLYQSFANALYDAEPPSGLSEEEEEIYREMLESQSAPIENAAVEKYVAAIDKANELKVYNDWTQKIIEQLSVLRPDEYKVGKKPEYAVNSILETQYPPYLSLDKIKQKERRERGISVGGESEKTKTEQMGEPEKESESKPVEDKNNNENKMENTEETPSQVSDEAEGGNK